MYYFEHVKYLSFNIQKTVLKNSIDFSFFYRPRPQWGPQPESGQPGQPVGRLEGWEEQETSAPATDSLHLPTVARTGGSLHPESVSGHERQRGDRHVDKSDWTQSQGKSLIFKDNWTEISLKHNLASKCLFWQALKFHSL